MKPSSAEMFRECVSKEEFLRFVVVNGSCWLWTGPLHPKGYPRIKVRGRVVSARTVAWQLYEKPSLLKDNSQTILSCGNQICVNPDHLVSRKLSETELHRRMLAYGNRYRLENKEKVQVATIKYRQKNPKGSKGILEIREYVDAIKRSTPCTDCQQYYPVECMDFDHVPELGPKAGPISKFMYPGKIDLLRMEISKCDVVCANCHRTRTLQRGTRGWKRKQIDNRRNPATWKRDIAV